MLWQLNGHVCFRYIACISHLNRDVESYIDTLFGSSMYMKSYKYSLAHMSGSNLWVATSYTPPLPPVTRNMSGRPINKRNMRTHSYDKVELSPMEVHGSRNDVNVVEV